MARPLTIAAPFGGVVVSLDSVGDEVFAAGMLGPGCAIDPDPAESDVLAPVGGVVAALHPHAFVIQSDPARSVLVHLGIESVGLGEPAFAGVLEAGAAARTGDVVVRWDVAAVRSAGRSVLCPVIALQASSEALRCLVRPGAAVSAGDPILEWEASAGPFGSPGPSGVPSD